MVHIVFSIAGSLAVRKASGRNRNTRDIASPRESDLRQVGLRRQICPQICFLRRGSVARVRSALRLANGKSFSAARLRTLSATILLPWIRYW